jgi:hypothetical protein
VWRRLLNVFGIQEALDKMSALHPIGRIGRPEEIADAVAWLFSDRSSYYTGQSLTLDGGLTSQRPYVTSPASDKLLQNARDERWRVGFENLEISENQNEFGRENCLGDPGNNDPNCFLRHPIETRMGWDISLGCL